MTQYIHHITLIVPEQYIDITNHLTLIMGESDADIGTFVTTDWKDAEGNLYSVCSAASKPVVLGALTKGLPNPLPAHAANADVTKAQQALDLIVQYEVGVESSPNSILLAIDYDPYAMFESAGISLVEDDESNS